MYSGNNILLVTNNETMIGLLSPELVQLRNIDSILIRNYQDTITTIESEKPQAIIINCQNNLEEGACLDLIKKVKSTTSSPIILLLETYNSKFLKAAYQNGINDCLAIQYANSEILMRTIWSLQKNELKQSYKKHEKLLIQLEIVDDKTGFYTIKQNSRVFNNEFEYLKEKNIDSIFLAVEPNKNSRLKPSVENLIETISINVRNSDTVSHTETPERFYILLSNTNLAGAMVVWNRLNKTIGADEALCGFISDVENKTFSQIEEKAKELLPQAINSPNLLYVTDDSEKKNENWLEDNEVPKNSNKNFKLFKQIFTKKMEKVIKPSIKTVMEDYEDNLPNTEIKEIETPSSINLQFINSKQESEFKITHTGSSIAKIETIHSGLDSPENNSYTLELNEINEKEIENILEDFLIEFKSCI